MSHDAFGPQPPARKLLPVRQSVYELLEKMERVGMSPAEWHDVLTTAAAPDTPSLDGIE
jgi:hypothetical protein